MLFVLPGKAIRVGESQIQREPPAARNMRPDGIEHGLARSPFIPAAVNKFPQITPALRSAPGVCAFDNGLAIHTGQGIGHSTPVRGVMSQNVDSG